MQLPELPSKEKDASQKPTPDPKMSHNKSGNSAVPSNTTASRSQCDPSARQHQYEKFKPCTISDAHVPPFLLPSTAQEPPQRDAGLNEIRQVFQAWNWESRGCEQSMEALELVERYLCDMSRGSWAGLEHMRLVSLHARVYQALAMVTATYGYRAFSNGSRPGKHAIYQFPGTEVQDLPGWLPLAHLEIRKENPFLFIPEKADGSIE